MEKKIKPIISICIPTYNRKEILDKCIASIVMQDEFIENKVEIVVMDNCSDDGTKELCEEYGKKYTSFVYIRNDINMDDRRYPLLLSKASGKLRKLSNDRVIYLDGSLGYMCQIVEKYYNSRTFLYWGNGLKRIPKGETGYPFQVFAEKVSYMLTWIGAFSLWDYDCENISEDIQDTELLLWQVRKIMDMAVKYRNIIVCNKRIMHNVPVPNKDVSYGLVKVFYYNFFQIIDRYVRGGELGILTRNRMEKDMLYSFFSLWCAEFEIDGKNRKYENGENLLEEIESIYKENEYWNNYLKYYWCKKHMIKMRKIIRKIMVIISR